MNCEELIGSLWQEAEKKIAAISRETEEEETRIVKEALLKINRLQEESQQHCSSASGKRTEETLSEARRNARLINIKADLRLSERLYRISQSSLCELRNHAYRDYFRLMAEELPPLEWKTVRINPEDAGLALSHFTKAEIMADDSISGGMDVMTDNEKIRVINTLEKRLERAWVDILPHIMKEFHETV